MMNKLRKNILMIVDRDFPTDHPFLEEVYSKIFPQKGYKIVWLFREQRREHHGEKIPWNLSQVYLIAHENQYPFFLRPFVRAHLLFKIFAIVKAEKIDFIQVRNWIAAGYCSVILRVMLGTPFVFQRSFPFQEANTVISPGNFLTSLQNAVTRAKIVSLKILINRADLVFAISEEMKRKMLREGYRPDKIVAVPLGYSKDVTIRSDAVAALKKQLQLESSLVILYIGTLSSMRCPEFMIRMQKLVSSEFQNAVLLIVGGTEGEITRLKKYSDEMHISPKVVFVESVPRREVAQYISLADICISPIPETDVYMVSSPTKLFEYMGQGKPVVGTRIPEQIKVLSESGAGLCVPFEEQPFAEAVMQFIRDENTRIKKGILGKEYAEAYLSYDILADKIEAFYRQYLP